MSFYYPRPRMFVPIFDEMERLADDFMVDDLFNDPFYTRTRPIHGHNRRQLTNNSNTGNNNNQKLLKKSGTEESKYNGNSTNNNQSLITNDNNNNNSFLSLWNNWDLDAHSSLEMNEEKDRFIVSAKLEGFDKEHLKLQVKDGLLTVSGDFTEEKKDDKNYSKSSRFVSRSMNLPKNIDQDKISAKYENGELKVIVPKSQKNLEKKDTIMIE